MVARCCAAVYLASMIHVRGRTADVVLDVDSGAPIIVYWGAPLGDVDLASVAAAFERPIMQGSQDRIAPIAILPELASGFAGRPGLLGHRQGGRDWAPRFTTVITDRRDGGVSVVSEDPVAGLQMLTTVDLDHALSLRVQITNTGTRRYLLDQVLLSLPLPSHARELLRFDGRWSREFQPVRSSLGSGAFVAENRTGRPSQEHPSLVFVGTPGFGEWNGEVWGAHLAWSGNHQTVVEVLADGRSVLQLGELLQPGELALEPDATYETPELIATYASDGLTPASWGFHRTLRDRPTHPTTTRKVLVNTWEAVYFDHDADTLRALAHAAAALGVERYVLDDGWFGSRRDDRSGLGDWTVSPDVYPDGLRPLIDHVRSLGMEFGIWVEPEMVNPDSDLYRAHPEWALVDPRYEPVLARNQLVLDLARPEAFAHILDRLDALLRDHEIGFVKWDMNRNHGAATDAAGAAGTHAQTLAVYRLLDELRARHPDVEIESCSSGGGRIDAEILRRTQRVWTSDCIDPLERQAIQRGVSMLLPPELMGMHIGATRSHTTGRSHSLAFRGATALFGHFGVEWNLLSVSDREREQLGSLIALHQRFRPLLHTGDAVRFDPLSSGPEPTAQAYGVYATDRSEALVAIAQLRTGISLTPPMLRLPGLDPDRSYDVSSVPLSAQPRDGRSSARRQQPAWLDDGITLTGRQLASHGVQLPVMNPETALLVHLEAH